MFRFRPWLLILSLLILGGGQAFAATREERAFAAAAAAFHDELWGRAETQFAQFIQKYPQSPRLAEAVLFTAQAQFKQGKYTAVIHSLTASWANPGPLADQFAYWLGEAQFAQGDFDHAADTFAAFPEKFPASPLALSAAVEAASAFERLGDWPRLAAMIEATNGVFARTVAAGSTNELIVRGRLLLATAHLAEKNFSAALATLKALESWTLPADLAWQRANLLCRVQAGAGI
jgi:tetratricopeptide (TPR) repeat protein